MRSSSNFALPVSIVLAALVLPAPAFAQIQLPGIYVQGTTLAVPTGQPDGASGVSDKDGGAVDGVPAATVGNAVTVVMRQDLERQQIRQVADALRSVPGVSVGRTGAFGNFTQVRIRGAEGNHTLVLIDGIEANNSTDGEFDFSNLSAEEIERIEVIRGPMSALYGSSAVGGVINIITRRGQGPLSLTLRTEVGSHGTADASARLAAGNDRGHFSLGIHGRYTDGFNIARTGGEEDGMRLRSLSFRGGVKIAEGLGVEVHLRHVDKLADRDGTDFLAPLSIAADDASTQHDRLLLGGVKLQWDTLDKALTHQVYVRHNSATISDNDVSFGVFQNTGERTSYGYLATYRFETPAVWALKQTLSGLIERESEAFTPEGTTGDGIRRERERVAFAGEWSGAFAEQVFITAGVRHDANSVFSDFTTWRLAGAWAIKSMGLRPHASIGTAVKFPGLFEQFGVFPQFTPNPDLQPEESLGWDAGVEVALGRGRALDITYFHADLTNKIVSTGNRPPSPDPSLANLSGTSTRDGIEVAFRARLTEMLTGTFAYTYLLAEDANGAQEVRRPRHGGRVDLSYSFAGGLGTANLGVLYNGFMSDNAFKNAFPFGTQRVLLDDYWLVNAAVSYRLQPGVELFARVENVLDQRYEEVFGFQAAPIVAFGGLKLTFGGPDGLGAPWPK
jgi:vitamin B12 transporter